MPEYIAQKPQSSDFVVKPGDYRLAVIEAKEDTSKSGNEMIKLKLRVVKSDGSKGVSLYDYLVFSETSFWKVDAFLKSAGRHPGEGKTINVNAEDLVGCEVEARLKVDKFNDGESMKVDAYLFDEDASTSRKSAPDDITF